MGYWKDRKIEMLQRGFSDPDGDICARCVEDETLAQWIGANSAAQQCTFCGREAEEAIAAPFEDFVGVVLDGITFDWNDPSREGVAYETAEGGFQARLSDTWEVLSEAGISEDEDVIDGLAEAIHTTRWVQRHFYTGAESERLFWGWQRFKHVTKHHSRYLFLKDDGDDGDEVAPSRMLSAISETFTHDLAGFNVVRKVAADVDIFRVRIDHASFTKAGDIGSPPLRFATQSNRMSPAGVPMFYGALDLATAVAETTDPVNQVGQTMSIGTFRGLRDLRVLDLADLPSIPSVFRADQWYLINPLRASHDFANDIAEPISRDGQEHIEYVPTQIVTEYFRRVFKDSRGRSVDGIIYPSSRVCGGKAIVLFAENEECVDFVPSPSSREPLLRMIDVDHQPVELVLPSS